MIVLTICAPQEDKVLENVKDKLNFEDLEKHLSDIKKTWPISIFIIIVSFMIS